MAAHPQINRNTADKIKLLSIADFLPLSTEYHCLKDKTAKSNRKMIIIKENTIHASYKLEPAVGVPYKIALVSGFPSFKISKDMTIFSRISVCLSYVILIVPLDAERL